MKLTVREVVTGKADTKLFKYGAALEVLSQAR